MNRRFLSLQQFHLDHLSQFTAEGEFGPTASPDFRMFYVGRDDVHGALRYLLTRVTLSLKLNMFGYDDDELNELIVKSFEDPHVVVQVTLDKSQAGGVHEKAILERDQVALAEHFASSFAIGQSATHQISHTKGGVLDGVVAFEGSTNWSASGEGAGINLRDVSKQPPGFKAQNNTLNVYTSAYEIAKFSARLDYEHSIALAQSRAA